MKKTVALILALVLCLSLTGALAADVGGVPVTAPPFNKDALPAALMMSSDTLMSNPTALLTASGLTDTEMVALMKPLANLTDAMSAARKEGATQADINKAAKDINTALTQITPLIKPKLSAICGSITDAMLGQLRDFTKLSEKQASSLLLKAFASADGKYGPYRDWAGLMKTADIKAMQKAVTSLADAVNAAAFKKELTKSAEQLLALLPTLDMVKLTGYLADGNSADSTGYLGSILDANPSTVIGNSASANVYDTKKLNASLSALMTALGAKDSQIADAFNAARYMADYPPKLDVLGTVSDGVWVSDGRAWVPMADLAKATGHKVEWKQADKSITLSGQNYTLTYLIGQKSAVSGKSKINLSYPPALHNGKSYLDLASLCDSVSKVYGKTLRPSYDIAKDTIFVTEKK